MLGSASFVIFLSKREVTIFGWCRCCHGGTFWNFLSNSLSDGRFSIDDTSLATSSRVFSWILPTDFHVSISFLFGWSGSCLLNLSTVSVVYRQPHSLHSQHFVETATIKGLIQTKFILLYYNTRL